MGGSKAHKKAAESNFIDWRTSSRIADPDEIFKAVLQSRHVTDPKHVKESQVKQGAVMLTQDQINGRMQRMNIIQQAVKDGTYNDPSQPWNRIHRWIEDGGDNSNNGGSH